MPAQGPQIDRGPYTYTVPPSAAPPAIRTAFASACTTISYFISGSFNRTGQSCTFSGKPLYPNATTLPLGSVMTAPILLLGSFDNCDTCMAMARYRSSHVSSAMNNSFQYSSLAIYMLVGLKTDKGLLASPIT